MLHSTVEVEMRKALYLLVFTVFMCVLVTKVAPPPGIPISPGDNAILFLAYFVSGVAVGAMHFRQK